MPTYAGLYLGIEISAVQVGGGNPVAIFGQTSRGERRSRPYLEAIGCGELIFRDAVVSRYLNIVDDCLRTFFNLECDINLRLVIDDLGSNLDGLVSLILVDGLQIVRPLLEQFLADASRRQDVRFLYRD